ncbi:hypothetical protein AB7M35_004070 [Amorphus suaedae]
MSGWGTCADRQAAIRTSVVFAAVLATGIGLVPLAAQATDKTDGEAARYAVGTTGIECASSPCPRRGIWIPHGKDETPAKIRHTLLFADEDGSVDLPNLLGSPADRAAVDAAWRDGSCLVVEGSFGPHPKTGIPQLSVSRIVGPC